MGCESCLLSNAAFAPFCFQLISEKLLEDPSTSTVGGVERIDQQLEMCRFLVENGEFDCYFIKRRKIDLAHI